MYAITNLLPGPLFFLQGQVKMPAVKKKKKEEKKYLNVHQKKL